MLRKYYTEIDVNSPMFDFKNYYQKIAKNLPDNCRVVEVGLNNGKSAIFLAEALLNMGKTIDRFIGVDNCAYGGQNQRNDIIKNIVNAQVPIEFIEMSSLDASCTFLDNYFDFIFLDSSHLYFQTRAEILLWYKKIKAPGILAGHDYYEYEDVKRAVDEIIPLTFTRPQHEETIFEPIKTLTIEETTNGFGVWECKKEWFVNLNY